ncbi:Eco57I restriction-modification methylase domain-containing protein [Kitasatospora sp. NPDC006697]|uniref:Eco57I restriction-modification methylase domain-containing protein n=1 Tax=Kitasatospora sp. NPDC006697 TaxID=3364020 RepID=UPI00369F054F
MTTYAHLTPADQQPAMSAFTAVRVENGLLPVALLQQIANQDPELPGVTPSDYWLGARGSLGEAASTQWATLKAAYANFRAGLSEHPGGVSTEGTTRSDWMLLLFKALDYGKLSYVGKLTAGARPDTVWPVSHQYSSHVPIHLVSWDTSLDRTLATRAPQSMLQDFLNTSDKHLWGLLSNGRTLRLLRDSTALVGSAYIEFDLEAIFDGNLYPDFVLLFALLHASRFELVAKPEKKQRRNASGPDGVNSGQEALVDVTPPEDEADAEEEGEGAAGEDIGLALTAADCRLEWWRNYAIETGTRSRNRLRDQVERALSELGTGFLQNNKHLTDALATGGRPALEEFHHELLRLAYQLIFLCVAEDREALLDSRDNAAVRDARKRYLDYFSTARLRRIASRRKGDRNTDLWEGLALVLNALGAEGGCEELALPELGGLYFREDHEAQTLDGAGGGRAARGTLLGSLEPLRGSELSNEHLLNAVRLLSIVADDQGRAQRVDYRHLGAEELGSIYESLLELIPRYDSQTGAFWLQNLAGNKRKGTGSYYTPSSVIEKLLDNALDPVIERFAKKRGAPKDLLKIRFVDPACGSGHVLVAAARRIARRYAVMETGHDEPTPTRVREIMADVVRECVHGVDLNPLAAELAKVSLWLETLVPGQPLAYLDNRIKVGNALLGTTPNLLAAGLPDGAFEPLPGDDRKIVSSLKAANKKERPAYRGGAVQDALMEPLVRVGTVELRVAADQLAKLPSRTLAQVREQARQHRAFAASAGLTFARRVADAWCAAFLWRKHEGAPPAITSATLRRVATGGMLPGIPAPTAAELAKRGPESALEILEREKAGEQELEAIVSRNQFFHWHLEFPRIFRVEDDESGDHNAFAGWQGGFDVVLGNPPWDRVKIQQKEWFAARDEAVADAPNASARQKLIDSLALSEDSVERELHESWRIAQREAAGTTRMLRDSGLFPLAGRGDVNLYAVFAEQAQTLLAPEGMSGIVVPTGIATDKTTAPFFADLVERRQLVAVLDMENEEKLFADVTNRYRFCLFVTGRPEKAVQEVRLAFQARRPDQLDDREFTLDAAGFKEINPNTVTSPVCEGPEHVRVLRKLHEGGRVLWRKVGGDSNPWKLAFQVMFHMSGDSGLFQTAEQLEADGWTRDGTIFQLGQGRAVPLYEGKHVHLYDSRFSTYEGATQAQLNKGTLPRLALEDHADPSHLPVPRYWVTESEVDDRLAADPKKGKPEWSHDWVIGWRDVCRYSDERTVISSVMPRTAVGHTAPVFLPRRLDLPLEALLANLSSIALDFAARQKISGAHLTYTYLEQLPILPPSTFRSPAAWLAGATPDAWIRARVLELTYTAYDLAPFARYLGDTGGPFVWDEQRRFLLRAELDAAFFHLYGIPAEDLPLILDSFRAFRNRTPELFEATKRQIIERYDAMADASASGVAYVDPALTPLPGHGPRHPAGSVPLTRPLLPEPAAGAPSPEGKSSYHQTPDLGSASEPSAEDGLFSLSEIGHDAQLGFWG